MRHFPAFFDLRDRICLVVGSGALAQAKAALLGQAGALVVRAAVDDPVIVPAACRLAVSADERPHDWLAALRRAGVPVNVADRPDLCDFVLPAIIDRDPVTIAVGTGGLSPVLARLLRGRIEAAVPQAFGALARFAGAWRGRVRDALPKAARRRFWETVLDGPIADRVLASGSDAEAAMAAALDRAALPATGQAGIVHLVGVGSDDPDLLTIKAMRLMGAADVIVHDGQVHQAIVDLARRDAERICVDGDLIARCLIRLALQGKRVVRLGAGQPSDDEAQALAAAGIVADLVPGASVAPARPLPQRVAAARV